MTRLSHPKFIVHCILSRLAIGCAEEGRIFDACLAGTIRTTLHSLIDGDYLTLKLSIPEHCRPLSVTLAKVTWVQGGRFGVELLMMDADERVRMSQFLDEHLPLEVEFQDSQSELTITAAE
ncbi:MAG: hypothetical protein M3M98_04170 [Nitrospirota bacterium]|nr:hypothetical protein [Nitrospirota bacterium]